MKTEWVSYTREDGSESTCQVCVSCGHGPGFHTKYGCTSEGWCEDQTPVCKCIERGIPELVIDESGESDEPYVYECNECGERFPEGVTYDTSPLYECGECGARYTRDYSADGNSHRCPDCNRFGSKLSDMGCPDCGNGELVTIENVEGVAEDKDKLSPGGRKG